MQEILRTHLPVDSKVWVYGSRATWTTKDSSDLDLAIEGKVPFDLRVIGALQDAFEGSNLPYTIDVVDINRISSSFKQIIEAQKTPLPIPESFLSAEVGNNQSNNKTEQSDYANFGIESDQAMTGNWQVVGEFSPFVYGKGLPKHKRNPLGKFPVYGSNGVIGHHDEPLTDGSTVIVGRKGTVGAVHYSPIPCWPIDTTFFITGDEPALQRYKYYALKSLGLEYMNADSAVPGLNRDEAHARKVYVPDPSEQRAVAHILGTLDDKIEFNHQMNHTLEEIAKAIFKSWFVDFDPVRAKAEGRPTGLPSEISDLFPNELVKSEIGEIPKGWEVKTLGDCNFEIESGRRPKGGIDKSLDDGIPNVGAESIDSIGKFDYAKVKHVTLEFASSVKKGWVKNYDVALYKDGGRPGQFIPRVGLYGEGFPFKKFLVNEHVFLLRSAMLGQFYLYYLVSSNAILDQLIARGSAKAAQPGLNQEEVRTSYFKSPDSVALYAFNDIATPIVKRQLMLGKENLILQELRDTLFPNLISGALRMPDVNKFLEKAGI